MHFVASGEVRVTDRRLQTQSLEDQVASARREVVYEREVSAALFVRLSRMCWAWDDLGKDAHSLGEAIEYKESIPPMYVRMLKEWPPSGKLLEDIPLPPRNE